MSVARLGGVSAACALTLEHPAQARPCSWPLRPVRRPGLHPAAAMNALRAEYDAKISDL